MGIAILSQRVRSTHLRRLDQLIRVFHTRSGDEVDQGLSRAISGVAQVSWNILAAVRSCKLSTWLLGWWRPGQKGGVSDSIAGGCYSRSDRRWEDGTSEIGQGGRQTNVRIRLQIVY